MKYRVVYEGVGGNNSMYPGMRCFVEYKSQEDFEARIAESRDIVVAQDVTLIEAQRLCDEVPENTMAWAAFYRGITEGNMDMHVVNAIHSAKSLDSVQGLYAAWAVIIQGAAALSQVIKPD